MDSLSFLKFKQKSHLSVFLTEFYFSHHCTCVTDIFEVRFLFTNLISHDLFWSPIFDVRHQCEIRASHTTLLLFCFWYHKEKTLMSQCENVAKTNYFLWVFKQTSELVMASNYNLILSSCLFYVVNFISLMWAKIKLFPNFFLFYTWTLQSYFSSISIQKLLQNFNEGLARDKPASASSIW